MIHAALLSLVLTLQAVPDAPLPDGLPFSEAVRVGGTLYLSGQLGNKPGSLELVEGGIEAETARTMDNIGLTLKRNGLDFSDLVMCRVFLADIADWPTFNRVYVRYFEDGKFPARSALGANGLALGAKVEVECIASYPETSEGGE